MRSFLSPDLKEEIRRKVDLVDLISTHVALRKAGKYYKGLCPFHSEKTPSFHVDREKGLWHCFGCQKGGTAFDFVMQTANLTFPEAVQELAHRAGVRLERTPEETRRTSEREQLLRVLKAAAAFFAAQLAEPQTGRPAREYLDRRGIDEPTVQRFGLGYAPAEWDGLLSALTRKGYQPALLEQAGLVQSRQRGEGYYDLFRHRLMFPIVDLQDRPVAFGGRTLDPDGQPKYLNSKETVAFSKGKTLYGLSLARDVIRQTDEIVVVEGNIDAVTCHQYGIDNAVASLGTALSMDQVLLMKRFAARAVLVYDADAAGMAASERAMALFDEMELSVRVVVLPSGDPDGFIRAQGAEAFRSLVALALPVFDYQVAMAVRRHDPSTVEGKVRIVDELLPALAGVANPVRQAEYVRTLAERFSLAEDAIRQRLRSKGRGRTAGKAQPPLEARPERARERAERLLLHLMIHEPSLRRGVAARLGPDDFADPVHRAVAVALFTAPDEESERLRERLNEGEQAMFLRMLFEDPPVEEKDTQKVVDDAISYLAEREPAALRRDALAKEIQIAAAAGDSEKVRSLQMQYLKLVGTTDAKEG
ncbi:MAG TPA: DNA primase [bacterium]|jgi:DNA primase|nr:DNA primase [bacterium]